MRENNRHNDIEPNQFTISFGNEDNEVDVETLISSLLHTATIIQEANKYLYPEKTVDVRIKALDKGSFEVHIAIVEKLISSLFSAGGVAYTSALVVIIQGIYKLHKHLKGEQPKRIEKSDNGSILIVNNNGGEVYIDGRSYKVYNESKDVRTAVVKQFGNLEKNEDIQSFSIYSRGSNPITIQREEFRQLGKNIPPLDNKDKEPIVSLLNRQQILILRPSFSKDLKWDFIYQGQKLSAKMEDEALMSIIDEGEPFSKGDTMLVDLEQTLFWNEEAEAHLLTKDSYKIKNYIKHIQRPRSERLFE